MKVTLDLEPWAIAKLDALLESPFCADRGFKMTRSDLLNEVIANCLPDEIIVAEFDNTAKA